MYNSKNYNTDGGDKLVIGGTLEIAAGGSVTGFVVDNLTSTDVGKPLSAKQGKVLKDELDAKTAANQADSTAADVAGVVADLNALMDKLKAAGIMTADA